MWKLDTWPGTKRHFGGEPKLAAWLYFNVQVGGEFRMRDLREALGDEIDGPGRAEHLNRRLRLLRDHDWRFDSYKDKLGQDMDVYVLKAKGKRIWLGEKNKRDLPSKATIRFVFDRDLNTCVICGVAAREPYADDPLATAKLTIGHRTPGARKANASPDNLQAECSRCNETVGDSHPNPETLEEVMAGIKGLGPAAKAELLSWIQSGRRHRSKIDIAYGRFRRLAPSEQEAVISYLHDVTD